jgi:co-chaperonin GroES (HSP10)
MIVALKTKDSTIVVPLKEDQIKSMLGVVIPASDAAIVLTPDDAKSQQVLVARAGRFNVVVSNQNGPIKIGDYVTISSVNGIGMKAGENEEQVVGKAASDFTGTSNVIGTVKLKDTTGKENNIALGRVMVDLKVSNNPLFQKSADYIPGFLSKVATTVANKPVSVARIYLCMALLVLSVAISSSMMYSGVRSGMIAVGRNPLSKKSIIKSLIQTLIAGLIVFVVGVLAVYLLLKL